MTGFKPLWLIAALFFATCACGQGGQVVGGRESAARLGEAIAQALNDRDANALKSLIDARTLALRSARSQGLSASDEADFVRGLAGGGLSRMIDGYFQSLNVGGGTVRFMRASNTIPARALVRVDLGDNGFDYLEYVVETRAGRTRAIDWFQLSTGEQVSDTIGGLLQLISTDNPSLIGRMLDKKGVDPAALAGLRKFNELKQAGKFAEALAALRQLPAPLANSRALLSLQAQLAILSKQDDEYSRALNRLAAEYSDNPAVAFMLVDYYFTRKDLPNMLKALDTMEKRVGVDGVTRQLRAASYFTMGDFVSCMKYADESIALEPDRLTPHHFRASALVGLGRYPDAVALYRDLEKRFAVQFTRAAFADDPQYAKFVASAAFRGWLGK